MDADREILLQDGKKIATRAKVAIAVLIANVVALLFSSYAVALEINVLTAIQQGHRDMVAAQFADDLVGWTHWFTIAALVAGGVAVVRWLAGTYRSAHVLRADGLRFSSDEAAWSFFVPFLSLYRPYQAVRDIYVALAPDGVPEPKPSIRSEAVQTYRQTAYERQAYSNTLPAAPITAWWTMWSLGWLLGLGTRSVGHQRELAELLTANRMAFANQAANIAAAILCILVVRGVTARVTERVRRLALAEPTDAST